MVFDCVRIRSSPTSRVLFSSSLSAICCYAVTSNEVRDAKFVY
jgi:hypothetical protein